MTIKEIALRALKTAIQTFGGTMGAVGFGWIDGNALKAGIIAAAVAGVSVVWNAVMTWAQNNED